MEELKEASDIKKLIGKNKGDEDPILVAQRFLNIFRQLHIFDQQRREEFNSMILALPPEIRGSFGNLPGGSLLQEYVDELEISRGMQRSSDGKAAIKPVATPSNETKDSPLSRAKNSPQTTPNTTTQFVSGEAKIVADASFAQVLSQSVSSALMAASASQSSNLDQILKKLQETGATGKIVPDEKFAAALARAFSQALQFSDANKKADIQELIKAVRESRKIELPDGFNLAAPTVTPPSAINESSLAKSIAETIAKVVKPGNFSQPQTYDADMKELVKAIRENKGVDVDALAKAMVNGLKPLLDSVNTAAASKPQQIKLSAGTDLADVITNALTKTFEISEKKHQEQTEKLIAGFQDVLRKEKADKPTDNSKPNPKNNAQQSPMSPIMQPQFIPAQILAPSVADNSEKFEKITQEFTKTLRSLSDSRKSENREIAQAIKDTQKELLKLLTIQNSAETAKDKKKDSTQFYSSESIKEIVTKVAQAQADIFQELSRQQTSALSTIISLALKESQKSSVDTIVDTFKKFQEHNIQLNLPVYQSIISEKAKNAQAELKASIEDNNRDEMLADGQSYIQKSIEAAKQQNGELDEKEQNQQSSSRNIKKDVAEYIKSEFEPVPLDEPKQVSGADWGFGNNDEENAEVESANLTATHTTSNDDGDWEWEYEEDDNSSDAQGLEGQDWEWEYEEDDNSSDAQGLEGQDWEWEYEEDDNSSDAQGLEGQDWEWEYEEDDSSDAEVSDDETSAPHEVLAETINEAETTETDVAEELTEPNETQSAPAPTIENITENHLEENSEQIVENVEKANSEETATPDKAIPQALSSAELLATIKAANPTADVMQTAEIGIAELRNHENVPDPYLVNNISV